MRELLISRLAQSWEALEIAQPPAAEPSQQVQISSESLIPAAALVPLVERPGGTTVLLTRRSEHLHDHAGQISFPGGRVEAGDETPLATALRETEEEVGLSPRFIDVVGYLDNHVTGTGFLVTPVVGLVLPGFALSLDEFEVAEVFEVPLDFVLDPGNYRRECREVRTGKRWFYVIEYEHRYVWGATAGMLVNLYEKLREV